MNLLIYPSFQSNFGSERRSTAAAVTFLIKILKRMTDREMVKMDNSEHTSNLPVTTTSRSTDRHKQVECKVCLRNMRSNTLKRHMLKHRELYTLDEDEIHDEIKRRKKLRETREEREQLVRKIAEEEGLPLEYCDMEVPDVLKPVSI